MDDRTVIEWDKDDLEALRLLKVDVLGLGMLSCLRRGFDLLRIHYGRTDTLPDLLLQEEDEGEREPVYRMIQRADTLGMFQIESRAQMSMLPRLRPKEFYDLVIEVAIVRPGPIQGKMVHPYLKRREAFRDTNEEPPYPSPSPEHGDKDELRSILKKTLGIPLFQEQAMRIAIVAAKFTPEEANGLRRAMATFKRVGTIEDFQKKFIEGMTDRGYDPAICGKLFRPDPRLRRIRLSGKPRGELRQPRLRLVLDEVPLPRRVRGGAAQQPADGLLCAGADRARRAGSTASRCGRPT